MSKWYEVLTPEIKEFIAGQMMFFVATAPNAGRINLSPKGMDTFRILGDRRVIYLDITGSGNETASHLYENGRITIMFCSFDKTPRIVRLYGHGRTIHPRDERWSEYLAMFPDTPGLRQIMEIDIDSAMTSCGYAVRQARSPDRARHAAEVLGEARRQRSRPIPSRHERAQHRRTAHRMFTDDSPSAK